MSEPESVLQLAMRTAVADAYMDAARIVRESPDAEGLPATVAREEIAASIEAAAIHHSPTPQEWWADAQPGVAALADVKAQVLRTIDRLPAHGDVAVMMLESLLARGIALLPISDIGRRALTGAVRGAIEEAAGVAPPR